MFGDLTLWTSVGKTMGLAVTISLGEYSDVMTHTESNCNAELMQSLITRRQLWLPVFNIYTQFINCDSSNEVALYLITALYKLAVLMRCYSHSQSLGSCCWHVSDSFPLDTRVISPLPVPLTACSHRTSLYCRGRPIPEFNSWWESFGINFIHDPCRIAGSEVTSHRSFRLSKSQCCTALHSYCWNRSHLLHRLQRSGFTMSVIPLIPLFPLPLSKVHP